MGRCLTLAELGSNHQGKLSVAEDMIYAAADAGADIVKFQKRDLNSCFTQAALQAPYDSENAFGATYGKHRAVLEFNASEYRHLRAVAHGAGVLFWATAFDLPSLELLDRVDVDGIKIASGDLTHHQLVAAAARTGRPVAISTGGADMEQVRSAVRTFTGAGGRNQDLTVMQCTAIYPARADQLHLNVISSYTAGFPGITIGASMHFSGISMAVAAYCLGARMIEMHFTLDRTMKGTDHRFSLEPQGFKKMVRDLRRIELALGDPVKKPLEEEGPALVKMWKSVVAARTLEPGTVLSEEDLAFRSPGIGLPPSSADFLIGRTVSRRIEIDELVSFADVTVEVEHAV